MSKVKDFNFMDKLKNKKNDFLKNKYKYKEMKSK